MAISFPKIRKSMYPTFDPIVFPSPTANSKYPMHSPILSGKYIGIIPYETVANIHKYSEIKIISIRII